jgi:hypothetical protein
LATEPTRKVVGVGKSTRLRGPTDRASLKEFVLADFDARGFPVALDGESRVALEEAIEMVGVAVSHPANPTDLHMEKFRIGGEGF